MKRNYSYRPQKWVDGVERQVSRITMGEVIGRELRPNEVVHHRDGNPANNNVGNLQLMSWGEHSKLLRHTEEAKKKISLGNWSRKLTPDDVREIRKMSAGGIRCDRIASIYGVPPSHISNIKNRKRWVWVK